MTFVMSGSLLPFKKQCHTSEDYVGLKELTGLKQ